MDSICTRVTLVTIEMTHFIQPQNIQIHKTYINRNNTSKTSPWKAHIPTPLSLGERKNVTNQKKH